MEELFAKLEKKEEAIAKLEVERRKSRATPGTDADSTASNPHSAQMDSPAADSSVPSGVCSTLTTYSDYENTCQSLAPRSAAAIEHRCSCGWISSVVIQYLVWSWSPPTSDSSPDSMVCMCSDGDAEAEAGAARGGAVTRAPRCA